MVCPFVSYRGNPVWRQRHTVLVFEQAMFCVANKVATEGTWEFAGQSVILQPSGSHLALAVSEKDEVVSVEIDRRNGRGVPLKRTHVKAVGIVAAV